MICIHIVSFNGLQTVEGQNYSFGAASKGYKRYQTMNKGLIKTIGYLKKKKKKMYMLYKPIPDFT